jgi:hypothetical protein
MNIPWIDSSSGLFLVLFLVRLFSRVVNAFSRVKPKGEVLKSEIGASTSISAPWNWNRLGEGLVEPRVEGDQREPDVEDGDISALDLLRLRPIAAIYRLL